MVWLASEEPGDAFGRMFEIGGGEISVAEGWQRGRRIEKHGR